MERKNRTLIEMARTMLDEYKTPRKFWLEAIDTACHVINRVYLHKLLNKTSYELLTRKKPNVSYFRVFGARCWIKDPHHTSKFAPKADEGFMLGYEKDSHSYRVFNTTKKDTSVTFWAERKKLCHTYDTSMTIIVTKPGIIIDVVGSYFYEKNHHRKWAFRPGRAGDAAA